jgi:hypothetical protein
MNRSSGCTIPLKPWFPWIKEDRRGLLKRPQIRHVLSIQDREYSYCFSIPLSLLAHSLLMLSAEREIKEISAAIERIEK